MNNRLFFFSDSIKNRFLRHSVFWLAVLLGQGCLLIVIASMFQANLKESFFAASFGQLISLPATMLFVYFVLYMVIPRVISQSGYAIIISMLIFGITVSALIAGCCRVCFLSKALTIFYGSDTSFSLARNFNYQFSNGMLNGIQLALISGGIAASIKLIKQWYEKSYRHTLLQKEKLDVELKSLKAQLHPHFLFNSLNNIYSVTQKVSEPASEMIARLSGLLSYTLYEGAQQFVTLERELKMLEDYFSLERIRYSNLDLTMEIADIDTNLLIAPLLFLPLAENCFKHGSKPSCGHSWIQVTIVVEGINLKAKFMNSRPEYLQKSSGGLGLLNLKKRLELLYPERHDLSIISDNEVYIVSLAIILSPIPKLCYEQENEHISVYNN